MTEVKNLTKKYGPFTAICDINFTIEKGHVYGLLGPNGAGKSTTMNIMTGCLAATSGTVTVNGHDIYEEAAAAKSAIGYLPEIPPLYADMTPDEYLRFVAKAKKFKGDVRKEAKRTADLCGVTPVANRLISHLSKGYKQRVGIAGALIGDPEVIILDEPTVGLDPKQIIEIRSLISSLGEDHAVVLSSHIMSEIAAVCDYVIIIACGEVVASGTIKEIEALADDGATSVEISLDAKTAEAALAKVENIDSVTFGKHGDHTVANITPKSGADVREDVFRALCESGAVIYEMTSGQNLESIFIKLTEEAALRHAVSEEKKGDVTDPEEPPLKKGKPAKASVDDYVTLFSDGEDGGDEK